VIETPDGLPYMARPPITSTPRPASRATAWTFGTLGGMMLADAIPGRPNPWTNLFEPERMAVRRGAWEHIKENTDYPIV
jgi:hypothetical protein